MDVREIIRQLTLEKESIDRAIAELEGLQQTAGRDVGGSMKKRRGRKSMNPEERRQVSERMKKFWANRKPRSA